MGHQVHQEARVLVVVQEQVVLQGLAGLQEQVVLQVVQGHPVQVVRQVLQELVEVQEQAVHQEHQVQAVHQEVRE